MPDQEDDKTPNQRDEERLLETSLKRFELSVDAERPQREKALEDLHFRAGDQWDPDVKSAREADGRPCLVIDVLPARERQILNDQRQNRPAIQVHPVDDEADPETAKVYQGVIRHIEVDSSADVAYDTATAAAVRTGGPGWIRVAAEYEHPSSLNQVLKIKRVRNQFMIYGDPSAQEPDRSDMKYLHAFCDYTKDEYKQEWPKSSMALDGDWSSIGDTPPEWLSKDGIRVAEYWYIEEKADKLYAMNDFSTKLKSKLGDDFDEEKDERLVRGKDGKAISRDTSLPVVRCCTHNAKEILDQKEWAGRWIPFIPVLGDELDVDGKLVLEGMVRHVKDAVREGNVMASAHIETIGMIPKAPWIVYEGQIPDEYRHMWETAHRKFWPYLIAKATDLEGNAYPKPERVIAEPAVQAITEARLQFNDDVKAVTGIYDAQLGQRSNEKSGTAINQRKQQGELGNFHYVDNLSRAIRHLGRILIDLIPKIYDTPRVLRIIGEDGSPKTQLVNASKLQQANPQDPRLDGIKHMHDLDVGTYDVVVSAGPSYATKRLEAVATQLELLKLLPPEISVNLLDIVVANMDLPGGELLVDRMKKMLKPGLADDDEQKMPIPPAAQQKMAQQGQMVEQLTQALNAAHNKLEQKLPEIESQERMKKMELDAKVLIAEIETKAQVARDRMKWDNAVWTELHGAASDHLMQSTDMLHEDTQRQAGAVDAAAMQQQQSAQAEQSQPDGA